MAEIVRCLIGPVIELGKCVAPAIKRRFNYLRCFNSNIQSLKKEAEDLKDARNELQMEVDAETNNGRDIKRAVKDWLKEATEIQNKTTAIETKIPNVQSCRLNIKSRYSLSKEAKKTAADSKVLRERCHQLRPISQPPPPIAEAPIALEPSLHEFQSRKEIEEDVMKALRDKKVHIMGICGMGGIGKTTLAKKLRKKVIEEKLFDEAAVATVSQQADVPKIQQEIAEQLGLKELKDFEGKHARAQKLHSRLRGPKKSLIVLDDIWEDLRLEDFGIPCESGSMECVVLLTSRSFEVLNQMNAKVFPMKILSDDEAWSLFREKVGTCVEDPDLISTAKEVAKECKGLPIALVTVGSALKDKNNERIWRDALSQLQKSCLEFRPIVREHVYLPLKLSYDFLNDWEAKSLFLLCCLFPEDFDISILELTYYCMGLRLLKRTSSMQQAIDRVFSLVDMLKSRFLILDGEAEEHVKMHDVVRDVAIAIALEEGRANVILRSMDHSRSDYRWISIIFPDASSAYDDLMPSNFPILNLLAIHHTGEQDTREIQDVSFLDGMEELNVLSLRRTSFRLLPQTMQSLKNLRTLIFDSCQFEIENISSVGNLVNLEILRCYDCQKIEELPYEMRRLKRLKLLEVSDCESLKRIAPGVISELVKLEELKMLRSFDGWESANINEEERKNASLKEVESLPQLTCLQIEMEDVSLLGEDIRLSPKIKEYEIRVNGRDYSPQTHKKVMVLNDLPREINLGSWIHKLARTTEVLHLRGDGSYSLDLSQVQKHVKSLEIRDSETMKNLMIKSDIIRDLESLFLENLPNLEELCDGPILDGNGSHLIFPKLKELTLRDLPSLTRFGKGVESIEFPVLWEMHIRDCPKLRRLASSVRSHQNAGGCNNDDDEDCPHLFSNPKGGLPQLKELYISNCEMMEEVFSIEENSINDANRSDLIFPKLETLWLNNLPSLTTFGKGVESIEFPVLTHLTIWCCPKLRRLASWVRSHQNAGGCNNDEDCPHLFCNPKGGFPQLDELDIFNCEMMEEVFSIEENSINDANGSQLIFPKLEVLQLCNLSSLTTFGKGVESIEFPVLSRMEIKDCPKLRRLPSWVRSHQNAGGCNNDQDCPHLFCNPKGGFPQLSYLWIQNCEMMKEVFSIEENIINDANGSDLIFPKLGELLLDNLPSLTTFGRGVESIEFPLLWHMYIEGCPKLRRLTSWVRSHQNAGGGNNDDDEDCPHLFCNLKGGFPRLWLLRIRNCEMMEEVFSIEENSINDANGSHLIFPKLKQLLLDNLPSLTTFGKGVESIEFPVLDDLIIEDCPKLRRLTSLVRSHQNARGCNNDEDCPHLFCNPKVTFSMLIDLTISGYNDIRRLFSPSITKDLLNLKSLKISSCEKMEEILLYEENGMNGNVSSIIPNLEQLELIDMPNLRTFYKGIDSIEFPVLNRMAIRGCSELVSFVSSNGSNQDLEDGHEDDYFHLFCSEKVTFGSLQNLTIDGNTEIRRLFSSSTIKDLSNLETLEISSCEKMKEVFLYEDNGTNGNVSSITFPNLEELELIDMPNLRTFYKGIDSIEFPVLNRMAIRGCSELVNFVSSNGSNQDLEDGHEDDYFHLFCSEKVAFCGLKDLEIGGYGNITNTWCHKIPHSFFRILEDLNIHDCGNIRILFSYSIVEKLVNLKILSIKSCKQMEKVNGGVEKIYEKSSLFPSLERLHLEDLSKLRSLCEWEWNLELPLLTDISISKCPEMEFLTPGSLSAPNLQMTEVDNEWIDRKELNEMEDLNDVLRQQMSKGMEATPSTPTDKDENEGQGTAKKSNIEDEEN